MQRKLSGPARHSDGGEAKREKGGRCLADQSGPQGRIGYGASRGYCWESLSSGGPYDFRRVQPHGPASSGLSRSAERRPSFRNAEPDAFRADRRGKPVRRNTVDRAEGVRPDSIFSSPGRLPFPSNVMGYGWSRLRCMGSGSRTRVRAVRREELPHGVGAYFAAESRSGSDGGAEASEIGISVCASSPARIRPPCRRGRANGGKPGCGPVVSDRLPGQKDRSIRFRLRPGP